LGVILVNILVVNKILDVIILAGILIV